MCAPFHGIVPRAVRRGTIDVAYNRDTTVALLEPQQQPRIASRGGQAPFVHK